MEDATRQTVCLRKASVYRVSARLAWLLYLLKYPLYPTLLYATLRSCVLSKILTVASR